jgi:hypothetical protein
MHGDGSQNISAGIADIIDLPPVVYKIPSSSLQLIKLICIQLIK